MDQFEKRELITGIIFYLRTRRRRKINERRTILFETILFSEKTIF